jgi:beta-phosphoglucomutase family hydrolase
MMESDRNGPHPHTIHAEVFRAALFDMDGVLTKTARLHAKSWKRLLDEFLKDYGRLVLRSFEPFDVDHDYRRYVDGRLRYDGVQNFLASRGIALPYGSPDDSPEQPTVCGLGNRKDDYFQALLDEQGVSVFDDGVQLLNKARAAGMKTAVVSASKHAQSVLEQTGLAAKLDVVIDGCESERLHLQGKPAPDTFLEAARRLSMSPGVAVVVEDALAGVAAGRRGGFGLIIAIDRADQANAFQHAGASFVVSDLSTVVIIPRNRL